MSCKNKNQTLRYNQRLRSGATNTCCANNTSSGCGCAPVSPCEEPTQYCCLCYSHQWYNAPKYSECSRRVKVNDVNDAECGCTVETVAQDNFGFNSCGCENDETDAFSELDELYWQ